MVVGNENPDHEVLDKVSDNAGGTIEPAGCTDNALEAISAAVSRYFHYAI
jgi:hypothetical protein